MTKFDKFAQLREPTCTTVKPITNDLEAWLTGTILVVYLFQSENVIFPGGTLYGPNRGIYKTFGLGDRSLLQVGS